MSPHKDLPQTLDKDKIKKLFLTYKKTHSRKIREQLILEHLPLVTSLARRFANRGEPLKDLVQVGNLGLIQAIDRFNPKKGIEFMSYATPTILGEIKRYFRDKGWKVKIPRKLQELNIAACKKIDELTQELQRPPTILEIAKSLKASEEDVIEALELGFAYNPLSLDAQINVEYEEFPSTLLTLTGDLDKEIESLGDKSSLSHAFRFLNRQERIIIYLRFYKNLSQKEIAEKMEVSQMQISRIQKRALLKLRYFLQKKPIKIF